MGRYFSAKPLASGWKELGCYLHLSPERLDRLAEQSRADPAQRAFEVLKMWQAEADRHGGTHFELVRVLYEHMGRFDLAIHILLHFLDQERELSSRSL